MTRNLPSIIYSVSWRLVVVEGHRRLAVALSWHHYIERKGFNGLACIWSEWKRTACRILGRNLIKQLLKKEECVLSVSVELNLA